MVEPQIEIRSLRTPGELRACVELQHETWGRGFTDVVPASLLKVSQRVGGVAAGAFDASDRLLGFVYGLTGVENGRIVHWSDMLAVRPEARNLGLGRRLKTYQRQLVAELGAVVIYWTYDPLVARNAHLNFNVFGVRVVEYVEDMYGDTDSTLHRGIGTDRFVVAWPVADAEVEAQIERNHLAATSRELLESAILNPGNTTPVRGGGPMPNVVRVEVPHDIYALQQSGARDAANWRQSSRASFQGALAAGLVVRGFVVDDCSHRGYYLLARP